jgi:NAD(P)-dependent dehydrogenase (short-subunit alcohol dehydrogenase family)
MSRILITGANSAVSRALIASMKKSESLILHSREKTINELSDISKGLNFSSWVHDLRDLDTLEKSLRDCLAEIPEGVNTFVHCAGVSKPLPAKGFTEKFVGDMFNVNIFSALKIVALLLNKSVNGTQLRNVVFVTSIWGISGSIGYTFYGSSKAALAGAMKSLSLELAPQTRVNCVALGAIESNMSIATFENRKILDHLMANYPLGFGAPEDAAHAINFLISDKAKWITGTEMVVDGGRTANMGNRNLR